MSTPTSQSIQSRSLEHTISWPSSRRSSMRLLWKCSVVVIASTVQSLGLTLQRLSYLDSGATQGAGLEVDGGSTPASFSSTILPSTPREVPEETADTLWKSRRQSMMLWRVGIALFVLANLFGSTVQLAVLPLVLVCTLQAVGLVANSVFACLLLREPITRNAIVGTIFVFVGAVLVAGSTASQSDPDVSLGELFKLLCSSRFRLWMSVTVISCIALGIYSRKLSSGGAAGDARISTICGWIWGVLGGVASAHSLLMAKLLVGLLLRGLSTALDDLLKVRFWAIALSFLIFALSQMWCVNCGLQRTSTSVLYPLVFCVYNVTTITNSAILYGSSVVFRNGHAFWVIVGTSTLIFGVLVLSTRFDEDNSSSSSGLPAWHPRYSSSRISMGTLAIPSPRQPDALSGPGSGRSSRLLSPSPVSPGGLLSPTDEVASPFNGASYTSFDAISPNITNPDKIRSRPGQRVLSKEQHSILRELGV